MENAEPKREEKSQRLEPIRVLGRGSQGVVMHAKDTWRNMECAVKYIHREWASKHTKYIARELLNHHQLSLYRHPHIVEFLEVVRTPNYIGIVMEYVEGTNLYDYLKQQGGQLMDEEARFIFQQLIIAVDFCFRLGKVNRDLKPANILVKKPSKGTMPIIKLCDFGFSKDQLQDSMPQTRLGTAHFVAPEILMSHDGHTYDACASDIWACGIILSYMLLGYHPFEGVDPGTSDPRKIQMAVMRNVVEGRLQLPPASEYLDRGPGFGKQSPMGQGKYSSQAMSLLNSMLDPNPATRITVEQILKHPWFMQNLPEGSLELNNLYLTIKAGGSIQTEEEAMSVMAAAIGPIT